MPQITLEDGRVVDFVKPNVSEKVLAQTHYRNAFKTHPREMPDVMASVDWNIMFPIFATLRRHGVEVRMSDLMDDEREEFWMERVTYEPGELASADETESEGEERRDPRAEPAAGVAEDPATPEWPPSTD